MNEEKRSFFEQDFRSLLLCNPFAQTWMESVSAKYFKMSERFFFERLYLPSDRWGGQYERNNDSTSERDDLNTNKTREVESNYDMEVFEDNVRHTNKEVLAITGAAGSGKTTYLNYLKNHTAVSDDLFFHIIDFRTHSPGTIRFLDTFIYFRDEAIDDFRRLIEAFVDYISKLLSSESSEQKVITKACFELANEIDMPILERAREFFTVLEKSENGKEIAIENQLGTRPADFLKDIIESAEEGKTVVSVLLDIIICIMLSHSRNGKKYICAIDNIEGDLRQYGEINNFDLVRTIIELLLDAAEKFQSITGRFDDYRSSYTFILVTRPYPSTFFTAENRRDGFDRKDVLDLDGVGFHSLKYERIIERRVNTASRYPEFSQLRSSNEYMELFDRVLSDRTSSKWSMNTIISKLCKYNYRIFVKLLIDVISMQSIESAASFLLRWDASENSQDNKAKHLLRRDFANMVLRYCRETESISDIVDGKALNGITEMLAAHNYDELEVTDGDETHISPSINQRFRSNINYAVYSFDGRHILSASGDNAIREWDCEIGECTLVFEGHNRSVNSVVYSADRLCVLSASDDKTIREWNRETGTCLRILNGHSNFVNCAIYSPDGQYVLSASSDKTIREWDRSSGECIRVFSNHSDAVISVAYSADGRRVLSASRDCTIREWDRETSACLHITGEGESINSAVFSGDGRRLLTASKDCRVWERDSETGEFLHLIAIHDSTVKSAIYSADERRVLSSSSDKTICEWDRKTGKCLNTFEGHSRSVNSAVYSADEQRVLSASRDGSIREWDRITGKCIRVFVLHVTGIDTYPVDINPVTKHDLRQPNSTGNKQNLDFQSEFRESLDYLSETQCLHFAWLCAIRVLPFTSIKRGFGYWKEPDRQRCILALFQAVDAAAAALSDIDFPQSASRTFAFYAGRAAEAAAKISTNVAADIAFNRGYAVFYAATAVADAAYAAESLFTAFDVADDAANAAEAAEAAEDTAFSSDEQKGYNLKKIMMEDIDLIVAGEKHGFNCDLGVYGEVWNDFLADLIAADCGYWARLYERLFISGFTVDESYKAELLLRINVPSEINKLGATSVGRYLERLGEDGTASDLYANEARIIILGEKGVGKTSLARRLVNPYLEMPVPGESTEGVNIDEWRIPSELGNGYGSVNASIWDFAGNIVTQPIHHCFMSPRCLYILVIGGQTEQDNRLEYWLEQIRNYGGESPVLVLVNKKDEHRVSIAENVLSNEYPSILGFYQVDIKMDGESLEEFRQDVVDRLRSTTLWNSHKIPTSVHNVKEALQTQFRMGNDYISRDEFSDIAKSCGVSTEDYEQILDALQNLGVCLWYNDNDGKRSVNTFILNPNWVAHGVYSLMNWGQNNNKHIIAISDFQNDLSRDILPKHTKQNIEVLFQIMRAYELAFTKNDHQIFIPTLLPTDQPETNMFEHFPSDDQQLKMVYRFNNVLPPYTVARLIVSRFDEMDEKLCWRSGAVFRWNRAIALVQEKESVNSIEVFVAGLDKTDYISQLRDSLNTIISGYKINYPELKYKVLFSDVESTNETLPMLSETEIVAYVETGRKLVVDFPVPSEIALDFTALAYGIIKSQEEPLDLNVFNDILINIFEMNYTESRRIYDFIKIKDQYRDLISEAFFLTDISSDFGCVWKAKLWQLCSTYHFLYPNIDKTIDQPQESETETHSDIIPEESDEYDGESVSTAPPFLTPSDKGEALENATLELFKMLFELDETAEGEILTMVRKQKRGIQFGFDIKVKYRTSDGNRIECRIECKNTKELRHEDVSPKIDQLRQEPQTFEHFIIINPIADPERKVSKDGNPDNRLDRSLVYWNEKDRDLEFYTQIWSPESNVKGFFGLIPEVYELFYPCDTESHPSNWKAGHREAIIADFKDRMKPRINLPDAWREYARKPEISLLLSPRENEFVDLYSSAVNMKAKDHDDGLLIDQITRWLKDEKKCLFLLGDFGDGKTFFTYYLSRRLIEEYKEAPKLGWLPIRFSLQKYFVTAYGGKTLSFADDSIFIERCLGAARGVSFNEVCHNSKVLIILDGFDEMSPLMDEDSIKRNMDCLSDYCEERLYGANIKVLITSRKHFFENQMNPEFMRRLGKPNMIQIAPIPRKIVVDYLKREICDERKFAELLGVHDIIGLATKPLFLRMLSEAVNNSDIPIGDLTAAKVYEYYMVKALDEKYTKSLSVSPSASNFDREEVIGRMHDSLGKIAAHLYINNKENVLRDEAIAILGKESADQLYELSEPTKEDNEDASNKIAFRSLCICNIDQPGNPITLCHRSMTEYLASEMIVDMLATDKDECRKLFMSRILKWEMIYFISQLINDGGDKRSICLETLNGFLQETASFDVTGDKLPFERLGRNSINIIYKTENGLPGEQYSGLIMDGANLMGANLSHKEFRNTSLKKANLCNVIFDHSDFSGADITDAQYSETYKIISVCYSASEKYIYVLYEDKSIWRWDIDKMRPLEKVSLELYEENPCHIVVYEQGRIAILEQGRVNQVSFYGYESENGFLEGRFRLSDDVKVINISGDVLLLEMEIIAQNISKLQYSTYSLSDHKSNSISTMRKMMCSSLGTQGILTCSEQSNLYVDDKVFLATVEDIDIVTTYRCDNDTYILAFGNTNGGISIAALEKSDYWCLSEIHTLKTFDKPITHLTFADASTLIAIIDSEEMYVLNISPDYKLIGENIEPLRLELLCEGMKIHDTGSDGTIKNKMKPEKEYTVFNRQIEKSTTQ